MSLSFVTKIAFIVKQMAAVYEFNKNLIEMFPQYKTGIVLIEKIFL